MASIQGRIVSFQARRLFSLTITAAVICTAAAAFVWIETSMYDKAIASGWTLLVSTAGLYGLSLRKRWAGGRRIPMAAWLQFHSYLGTFALAAFCLHVRWPIRGQFELALGAMFLFVSLSGIFLLVLSRRMPRLLSAVKSDARLEDIPRLRAELGDRVHDHLALDASQLGEGAALAELYEHRLLKFFHSPRSLWYRTFPNGHTRRRLLRDLEDMDRYLDPQGRSTRQVFSELVIRKDDLDFHQAIQRRLRNLVTLHTAFTWSLILMIAVHVVLALEFQGAMR
ncbi:MAG: hypothetical protein U0892_15665 [Pirellulales bacterium]